MVADWLNKEANDLSLKLLYRGSEQGFRRSSFAKHCNDRGPTLTLIKSDLGHVFGGFTSISWATPEGDPSSWKYYEDPEAFLFSLTHKTKHKQVKNF